MKNPFKREVQPYKQEEPTTPYQRAQQEWDLRIGTARVQAKNWRIISYGAMALAFMVMLILCIVLATRRERIYIAEVTREGKVVNVAPLLVKYQPTTAQIRYFLVRFIELTRAVPLDPVLAKRNWLMAYSYLGTRSAEQLNRYFRERNPISFLGKKTVSISINDVNQISATTLHVDWTETVVNSEGQEEAKTDYSGVFTIAIKQPTRQREILNNPLGIYIVEFSISVKEHSAN